MKFDKGKDFPTLKIDDKAIIRLVPTYGHADPPSLISVPSQKVIMNGAECSEQNGKNNKKILRFFFRVIIDNWGDFFTKMTLK